MNKNNEINEDITLKVLSKIAINVINTGLVISLICSLVLHENRLFF